MRVFLVALLQAAAVVAGCFILNVLVFGGDPTGFAFGVAFSALHLAFIALAGRRR